MGSLSFAEIATILIVILIIFGPDRLPEFARKVGELLAQARRATSQLREDVTREWSEGAAPIIAAKEDYEGIKGDLKQASKSFTDLVDTKPVDLGGPTEELDAESQESDAAPPPVAEPEEETTP